MSLKQLPAHALRQLGADAILGSVDFAAPEAALADPLWAKRIRITRAASLPAAR